MKILYLISCDEGVGAGGHYNSMHQVSMEMASNNDVKVMVLGKAMSPILKQNPYFKEFIKLGTGFSDIIHLNKKLKNIFKNFYPDLIHCFDTNSLNRILLCKAAWKLPIVLNKCGGRNPLRNNYQHADATVVFSHENLNWYLQSIHYTNSSIYLIPNRVRALEYLSAKEQKEQANPAKVTFVRISRLGGAYELTLLQSFALLGKLSEKLEVELFVIGRIQNNERFEQLKAEGSKYNYKITYITDSRAEKGSSFLYLADFVIGTGRSFMEATSLGLPTLTPASNSKIPILVDKENVKRFLATNFSERNMAEEGDEQKTLDLIESLARNDNQYATFSNSVKHIFDEYFGTEKINEKYTEVYQYALSNFNSRPSLIWKNLTYIAKFLIK